jgi:hypothetical protein
MKPLSARRAGSAVGSAAGPLGAPGDQVEQPIDGIVAGIARWLVDRGRANAGGGRGRGGRSHGGAIRQRPMDGRQVRDVAGRAAGPQGVADGERPGEIGQRPNHGGGREVAPVPEGEVNGQFRAVVAQPVGHANRQAGRCPVEEPGDAIRIEPVEPTRLQSELSGNHDPQRQRTELERRHVTGPAARAGSRGGGIGRHGGSPAAHRLTAVSLDWPRDATNADLDTRPRIIGH